MEFSWQYPSVNFKFEKRGFFISILNVKNTILRRSRPPWFLDQYTYTYCIRCKTQGNGTGYFTTVYGPYLTICTYILARIHLQRYRIWAIKSTPQEFSPRAHTSVLFGPRRIIRAKRNHRKLSCIFIRMKAVLLAISLLINISGFQIVSNDDLRECSSFVNSALFSVLSNFPENRYARP